MNAKQPWYKKWWVWLISIAVLLFLTFGIPLIINNCYIKNKGYITVWGGTDVFQFYGSILSFLGTVVLGIIAVWQNNRANEVNKSIMEMTRRDKLAYLTPKSTLLNSNRNIEFDFKNKGNSFGIIKLITLQKDGRIILQKAAEDFVDCETEYTFTTNLETPKTNEGFCMIVEFLIQNPFGYEYVEKIIMNFVPENKERFALFHMETFNIVFRNAKEAL